MDDDKLKAEFFPAPTAHELDLATARRLVAEAQRNETTYRIPLGGREYEFAPLDAKALEKTAFLIAMGADETVSLGVMFTALKKSAGESAWSEIVQRFTDDEINAEQIMDALKALSEAMGASKTADGA